VVEYLPRNAEDLNSNPSTVKKKKVKKFIFKNRDEVRSWEWWLVPVIPLIGR
jgi:hypothetical protein